MKPADELALELSAISGLKYSKALEFARCAEYSDVEMIIEEFKLGETPKLLKLFLSNTEKIRGELHSGGAVGADYFVCFRPKWFFDRNLLNSKTPSVKPK